MKKILIVASNETYQTRDLEAAAARMSVPLQVCDVAASSSMKEFEDVSLIYWRSGTITKRFPHRIGRDTLLCEVSDIVPVVNRGLVSSPHQVYKSVQQSLYRRHIPAMLKVRPIETFLVKEMSEIQDLIEKGKISYPFIAKPNCGAKGKGIELISSYDELKRSTIDWSSMVVQNFIPNRGDYRVLVVGGVVHDIVLRQSSENSTKDFLNNLSQGGSVSAVTNQVLRNELSNAALAAASIFGYTICGVDIIEGDDGTLYFLEINSVPQWEGLASIAKKSVAEHILGTLVAIATKDNEKSVSKIRDYYLTKLPFLRVSTRFHLLSRLYLWSGKVRYSNELRQLEEEWWTSRGDLKNSLVQIANGSYENLTVSTSLKMYRERAHRVHAKVRLYNKVFFGLLFDKTIFDGKRVDDTLSCVDVSDLREVRDRLLRDPQGVFELSTPAVNFLFLCDFFFAAEGMKIDAQYFLDIADSHKIENPQDDFDARLYFYTHVIISISRFYLSDIPEKERPVLIEMLQRAESMLLANYSRASLDHKCEFLVCAKICSYESPLYKTIESEVDGSYSKNGLYLVNKLNYKSSLLYRDDMESMEHTNVLAMMAFLGNEGV